MVTAVHGADACEQSSPVCLLQTPSRQYPGYSDAQQHFEQTGSSPLPLLPHTPVLGCCLQGLPQAGMRQQLGKRISHLGKRISQSEGMPSSAYRYNKGVLLEEEKSSVFFCCYRFSCCYF